VLVSKSSDDAVKTRFWLAPGVRVSCSGRPRTYQSRGDWRHRRKLLAAPLLAESALDALPDEAQMRAVAGDVPNGRREHAARFARIAVEPIMRSEP
jgi:hypothetical protein